MNLRMTARPLAALATLAIVLAACGNGAATTAPVTQAPATQPPATQPAATQGAVATDDTPSFALPSFHSDQKLEDLFPKQIGGMDVTVLSMSGDQFMLGGATPELTAALGALGKSASDLSVAFGSVGTIAIIAFKVSGVPASAIQTSLFAAYQQDAGSTISDTTISGKSVKKIAPTDTTEDVLYVYGAQDVIFSVTGTDVTDAQLNEVFSKLP